MPPYNQRSNGYGTLVTSRRFLLSFPPLTIQGVVCESYDVYGLKWRYNGNKLVVGPAQGISFFKKKVYALLDEIVRKSLYGIR